MLDDIRLLLSSLVAVNTIEVSQKKWKKQIQYCFRFNVIQRTCLDWRCLLASPAVSMLRSQALSYNKRNYFNFVKYLIIAGNPQKSKRQTVPLNLSTLLCGFMLQKEKSMCLFVLSYVPFLLPKITFLNLAMLIEIWSGSRWSWWWHFILKSHLCTFSSGPGVTEVPRG